jgi:hypothetical protein
MSDWKNSPEWIADANNLNDCIKMLHKQVDKVGYKSDEGKALLEKTVELKKEFSEKWGKRYLISALFIKQTTDATHKTIVNKRSREDY